MLLDSASQFVLTFRKEYCFSWDLAALATNTGNNKACESSPRCPRCRVAELTTAAALLCATITKMANSSPEPFDNQLHSNMLALCTLSDSEMTQWRIPETRCNASELTRFRRVSALPASAV